jgi:recombination protein RecA
MSKGAVAIVDPLAMAHKYLEGAFGKGAVMDLDGAVETKNCIPTGHPYIDYVLGGGWYYGKHHELYGYESSGKSTLAYQGAANAQIKKNKTGRVLLLDYEHAFDVKYFRQLGGKTDRNHLQVAQPETAEEGFEIARVMIDNDLIDMMIVDSVAAMMSFKESGAYVNSVGDQVADGAKGGKQQGSMGEMRIGLHAQIISQALKQLSARMGKHDVATIWINQIRTKINTNRPSSETTTGGNALKFYAAVRLEMRKMSAKKGKIYNPFENATVDGIVAIQTLVKAAKNKECPPFREAPITIGFGTGMQVEEDLLQLAVKHKFIEKTGQGWYKCKALGATRDARGEQEFLKLLKEEPTVKKTLMDKVDLNKLMDGMTARVVPDEDDKTGEEDKDISALLSSAEPGVQEQIEQEEAPADPN